MITKKRVQQIIKEEVSYALREATIGGPRASYIEGESPLVGAMLNDDERQVVSQALEGSLDFYGTSAYEKLFDYYWEDMPYGIKKARTGDPDVWILDRLEDEGIK